METKMTVKVAVEVAVKNKRTGASIDKEPDGKKIGSNLHRIRDGFVQFVDDKSIVHWDDDFVKARIIDWDGRKWVCRKLKNTAKHQKRDHSCSPKVDLSRMPDVTAVQDFFEKSHLLCHMKNLKWTILSFKDGKKLDLDAMADVLLLEEQIRSEESDNAYLAASTHAVTNAGAERLVFSIKSLTNNEYRVNPEFGFVEPGGTTNVEIARLRGPDQSDKMVVHFATCPADAVDPTATFATATPAGQLTIQINIA